MPALSDRHRDFRAEPRSVDPVIDQDLPGAGQIGAAGLKPDPFTRAVHQADPAPVLVGDAACAGVAVAAIKSSPMS